MDDNQPAPERPATGIPTSHSDDTKREKRLSCRPMPPRRRHGIRWIAAIAIIGVIILFVCLRQTGSPKQNASDKPIPAAAVVSVVREDLTRQVEIPAEFRPYVEVELHAKATGYMQSISVDFGDRVKSGQLLAVLEVPELKAEVDASIAGEKRAEADYTNAHLIYQRLVGVNKEHPNLVAQQDIDTAEAKDVAGEAAVAAAKADVEKYQTLFDYTRITAPFDGVITGRYADPGALIQAGTETDQSKALLRISDNYVLRLDFPVSVEYVRYIHDGDLVRVRVDSLGGKTYTGRITRFTHKVNEDTRTMMTEIEVPNPALELTPGMYAAVVLNVEQRPSALAVPIEAVSSGDKPAVYLVNSKNEIEERPVMLGLETATRYEILDGLKEGDKVVIGIRSEFHPGEKVNPKPVQTAAVAKS
jgi:RND family efflux transporter MFP subunit